MGTFAHWICISLQPIYDWSEKNIETIKTSSHGLGRIKSRSLQQILLSWLFYVDIFHNRLDGRADRRPLKCLHIYINYTFGFGKKREKNWRQKNASEIENGPRLDLQTFSWRAGRFFRYHPQLERRQKRFLGTKNIFGFFLLLLLWH